MDDLLRQRSERLGQRGGDRGSVGREERGGIDADGSAQVHRLASATHEANRRVDCTPRTGQLAS